MSEYNYCENCHERLKEWGEQNCPRCVHSTYDNESKGDYFVMANADNNVPKLREKTNFEVWVENATIGWFIDDWLYDCDNCPARTFHPIEDQKKLHSCEYLGFDVKCEETIRKWANATWKGDSNE